MLMDTSLLSDNSHAIIFSQRRFPNNDIFPRQAPIILVHGKSGRIICCRSCFRALCGRSDQPEHENTMGTLRNHLLPQPAPCREPTTRGNAQVPLGSDLEARQPGARELLPWMARRRQGPRAGSPESWRGRSETVRQGGGLQFGPRPTGGHDPGARMAVHYAASLLRGRRPHEGGRALLFPVPGQRAPRHLHDRCDSPAAEMSRPGPVVLPPAPRQRLL